MSVTRQGDQNVLKASLIGGFLASATTAGMFEADALLHPVMYNLEGVAFTIAVFAVSLIIGTSISIAVLSIVIAHVGQERLVKVPFPAAALMGASVGAVLLWFSFGAFDGEWEWNLFGYPTIGALYGGMVSGFWSYFTRRALDFDE